MGGGGCRPLLVIIIIFKISSSSTEEQNLKNLMTPFILVSSDLKVNNHENHPICKVLVGAQISVYNRTR